MDQVLFHMHGILCCKPWFNVCNLYCKLFLLFLLWACSFVTGKILYFLSLLFPRKIIVYVSHIKSSFYKKLLCSSWKSVIDHLVWQEKTTGTIYIWCLYLFELYHLMFTLAIVFAGFWFMIVCWLVAGYQLVQFKW